MLEILPDASPSLLTAAFAEQESLLTTFVKLVVKEEEEQKKKAADSVIGETTCR